MCPGCFEALALLIVGVGSTGGVAALIASKFRSEPQQGVKDLLRSPIQEEESCLKQPTSR